MGPCGCRQSRWLSDPLSAGTLRNISVAAGIVAAAATRGAGTSPHLTCGVPGTHPTRLQQNTEPYQRDVISLTVLPVAALDSLSIPDAVVADDRECSPNARHATWHEPCCVPRYHARRYASAEVDVAGKKSLFDSARRSRDRHRPLRFANIVRPDWSAGPTPLLRRSDPCRVMRETGP